MSSFTHSWAMQALLTVWFCWRISFAGSGRWWWEPPWWCTWSWPRRPPGFGSDGVSEHRGLSHWKAHDYSCLPSWLWIMVGRLARGISLDRRGRPIWVEGLGGKQSMLFIPFLKKKKTVIDKARCINSRRTVFFPLHVYEIALGFIVTALTGKIRCPIN